MRCTAGRRAHPSGRLPLLALWALGACAPGGGEKATGETGAGGEETGSPTPAEAAPALPTTPTDRGPYTVGVTTMSFTDARGKDLVVEVWYPGEAVEGDTPDPYEPTVLSGTAYRGLVPDLRGAPYPVLAFSHGMAGIRFQSVFLTEHLASWGYVVVSPDHPRNTFLDIDPDATIDVILERPDDVRNSVDEFARRAGADDPALGGLLGGADTVDAYVALGHSFGALTTLILGGGAVDFDAVLRFCARSSTFACSFVDGLDASMAEGHGMADPRITGIVPYAPGVWYAFGDSGEGLAETVPPLVFLSDADDVLPYTSEGQPTYAALAAPKLGATFHGAGHYAYSDICELVPFLFDECTETGWLDIEVAHENTLALTVAWLQQHVRGDDSMAAWLDPTHWDSDPTLTLDRAEAR